MVQWLIYSGLGIVKALRGGDVKQAIFININLFRSNAKHVNQTLRFI